MNRLSTERRAQVVACLVEGNSIRATVRMTGVAKNTVVKLLADLGAACAEYQDATLTDLTCERIEVDEIWSFCNAKAKNVPAEHEGEFGWGDVWTFTAIDADTKLAPTWLVGQRTKEDAELFMLDLASRLANRVQLTSDAWAEYRRAVNRAFGTDIDFAQLRKTYYGADAAWRSPAHLRYSPSRVTGQEIYVRSGDPEPAGISTSYVERQNLTMRMGMRRFTRLTNGFSRKVENLAAAVSLHFAHYNLCRVHQSLTLTNPDGTRTKRTPAMAAGVADHVWTTAELVGLLDSQVPVSN
jgi:IS1 family transposase